ncbi:MAG: hypothetical protein JNM52_09255 [Betaproteobacteria bacterium]|nr:hypothetical protein [Betaproteobacteria bacterium]
MSSGSKKRDRSYWATETDTKRQRPQEERPRRGDPFLSRIKGLMQPGGDRSVLGGLNIPYQQKVTTNYVNGDVNVVTTNKAVDSHGTFGVTHHPGSAPGQYWTQGMLQPMQDTSYFGKTRAEYHAVPNVLTEKRALVESRAMKYMSLDAAEYTPKATGIKVKITDQRHSKPPGKGTKAPPPTITHSDADTTYWGGLTMGSFLEDITGQRGMGIPNVGSAIRAMTMASKWRMKTSGAVSEPGFGDKVLEAFPQVGKGAIKEPIVKGLGTHATGVAALRQEIVGPNADRRMQVLKHHIGLKGSVFKAHLEAQEAAGARFDQKLAIAQAAGPLDDLSNLGKWWADTKSGGLDFAGVADPTLLRKQYVADKMDRHGIARYPDVGRVNDIQALKATNKAEYIKQKRAFVKGSMEHHGFDTREFTGRWFSKDSFKKKLDAGIASGATPAGKWWAAKAAGGTNFAALSPAGRKALQQEYVDHKRAKWADRHAAKNDFQAELNTIRAGTPPAAGSWWDTKATAGTNFNAPMTRAERKALRKDYIKNR